jgi:IS30 family transposase
VFGGVDAQIGSLGKVLAEQWTTPLLRQYFRKGADLSTVEQAEVRFAADEINGRPRAVLDWDSATARFASLQTVAALQTKAVSDGTEKPARLPKTGDIQ